MYIFSSLLGMLFSWYLIRKATDFFGLWIACISAAIWIFNVCMAIVAAFK